MTPDLSYDHEGERKEGRRQLMGWKNICTQEREPEIYRRVRNPVVVIVDILFFLPNEISRIPCVRPDFSILERYLARNSVVTDLRQRKNKNRE